MNSMIVLRIVGNKLPVTVNVKVFGISHAKLISNQGIFFEFLSSSLFRNTIRRMASLYISLVTQREKCPNTEFFMVRIFLYSD